MEQRLQKLLAAAGIASRRSCEAYIAAGRVTVNGQVIKELGTKADIEHDDVRVDGKPIARDVPPVYIVLNKPTGYVTTVRDKHAEHTVMELVRDLPGRVYPVGRLDADSAGLLLLTNDGAFTEKLTHPSHQVPKTYRAVVRGEVPAWAAADLRQGIILDDGMTAPAQVEWVDYDEENNATIVDITIHEGRNRQVRRMFDAIGYPVLALTRMRIGPVELTGIPPGRWRKLRPAEVKALLAEADVRPPSLPQKPPAEPEPEPVVAPRQWRGGPAGPRPRRDERSGQPTANRQGHRGPAAPRGQGNQQRPIAPANRQSEQPERSQRMKGSDVQAAADALWQQLRSDSSSDEPAEPQAKLPAKRPLDKPPTGPAKQKPPGNRSR